MTRTPRLEYRQGKDGPKVVTEVKAVEKKR